MLEDTQASFTKFFILFIILAHLKQIILSSDNSWRTPYEQALTDQNSNPRPGSVVDRGVTAIYPFDFFQQGEKSNVYSSFFLST